MKNIYLAIIAVAIMFPTLSFAQGCMGGDSEDGVKVVGYIQPQFEYQFLGDDVAPLHGLNSENSFYFNRARVGVVGNIPYDFSYYVMAELSPTLGGPYLLDAFITYKRWDPYLHVSFGQFKTPFGLELTTPCQSLHTVNRSMVVNELASPFRDLGVMFLGSSGELLPIKDLFKYRLAISNGTGLNQFDTDKYKDFTGRLIVTPLEGLSVGGSYKYGKSLAADAEDDATPDEKTRWGVDVSFEKYNALFQAEYIDGNDKGSSWIGGGCGEDPTLVEGDFKKNGFMVLAGYMTPWNIQPILKFESYDPDTDVDYDKQQDWTFGINYFFNEWTRVQLNYVYRAEESSDDWSNYNEIENDFFVLQVQVVF